MKRNIVLALVLVSLVIPSLVFAQNKTRTLNFAYDEYGATEIEPLSRGRVAVTTQSLHGYGTVAGFVGRDLELETNFEFDQDLRIVIEFTSAGVKGETRGDIFFEDAVDIWEHAGTGGPIRGKAACIGDQPNPCRTVRVTLESKGDLYDPDAPSQVIGRYDTSTTGTLTFENGSATWSDMSGTGSLRLK